MRTAITLSATRIVADDQVELMRQIRNAGRHGFSMDNREITADQQVAWWQSMQGRIFAWLYSTGRKTVAFGLLRQRANGQWTTSAGVLPEYAGRGYGGAVVDDLVDQACELGIQLWAQARLDNPAAVKTHHLDHWDYLRSDDTYAYFRSKP